MKTSVKNPKINFYIEMLSVMNFIEMFKMFNIFGKILFIMMTPILIIVWISWACICTGAFLGTLAIKNELFNE